jgi:TonB family protein
MRNCVVSFLVPILFTATTFAQAHKNASPSPTPSPTPQSSPGPTTQTPKKFPSPFAHPVQSGGMEIITDTRGVDFGAYMIVLKDKVNKRWVEIMPKSALPPELRSGEVSVMFSILRNGKVQGLSIDDSSGDKSLDQAAFDALADSSPLPALPEAFVGDYLMIRAHFVYNPAKQN